MLNMFEWQDLQIIDGRGLSEAIETRQNIGMHKSVFETIFLIMHQEFSELSILRYIAGAWGASSQCFAEELTSITAVKSLR